MIEEPERKPSTQTNPLANFGGQVNSVDDEKEPGQLFCEHGIIYR